MNNAAKAEAQKDKAPDNRKPQNPDALRSQEQRVTHDKVSCKLTYTHILNEYRLILFNIA